MKMNNYFEHIHDYLDGLLSQEENAAFDKELSINEALREETQSQKRLMDILKGQLIADQNLEDFKSSLKSYQKSYFGTSEAKASSEQANRLKEKQIPKTTSLRRWSMVIGVAACLLIGLNFLGIFSPNLMRLPAIPSETTRGGNNEQTLTEAIARYNAKEYDKSIPLFSTLLEKDSANIRFQYYLGLSHFGNKQLQEAVDILQPIAEGSSIYSDAATYYIAVIFWQENKNDQSASYAAKVLENSPYYKKAQLLLKKVSGF